MPLTDVAIRRFQPEVKPRKLSDSGGLFLYVTPSGGKLWRWKYTVGGKEKLMALGQYPKVTLAEARVRRDDARKQKNCGVDPMAARKTAKLVRLVAAENSFATVGRAWFVQWKGDRNARHADYT